MSDTNPIGLNSSLDKDSIVVFLLQQMDNFPALKHFIISKHIRPSTLFLPQVLSDIDAILSTQEEIVLECLDFLDIVKFYSLITYGDSEWFINSIKNYVIENRVVDNFSLTLASEALNDFIINNKEDANALIENNKLLLSIYLFCLLVLITFENINFNKE